MGEWRGRIGRNDNGGKKRKKWKERHRKELQKGEIYEKLGHAKRKKWAQKVRKNTKK